MGGISACQTPAVGVELIRTPLALRKQTKTPRIKKMQFKHCTLEIDGPVATLTLNHQEVMNAVSVDMLGGLQEALNEIEAKRDEVRCVVLTGAGRAFCTGA